MLYCTGGHAKYLASDTDADPLLRTSSLTTCPSVLSYTLYWCNNHVQISKLFTSIQFQPRFTRTDMPFRGTDTSDMEQRTWFTEQEFRDDVDKVCALALMHAMLGLSLA